MSDNIASDLKQSRRDRHDIAAEILKTAVGGKIKTHIMYKAKLSYAQLNEYLPLLVDKGFLETRYVGPGRKEYITTKKGTAFIENLDSIHSLWAKGNTE